MNMDKNEEYKIVRDDQANEELVKKLMCFKEYINDDLPEWKQLIAIGGFVANVVKLLKWSEHKRSYQKRIGNYADGELMTCDEICEEIWIAINYSFNAPYMDELNTIWSEWNTDQSKYPEAKTVEDICDVIAARMEQVYPGLVETADEYFHFSDEK